MRYIGYGHQNAPAIAIGFCPDGIVKIARICPIDGDKGNVPQVGPAICVGDSQAFGLGEGIALKDMANFKFRQRQRVTSKPNVCAAFASRSEPKA